MPRKRGSHRFAPVISPRAIGVGYKPRAPFTGRQIFSPRRQPEGRPDEMISAPICRGERFLAQGVSHGSVEGRVPAPFVGRQMRRLFPNVSLIVFDAVFFQIGSQFILK